MVSDSLYEICLPILRDEALEEEDRTEKLEDLLRKQTTLTGKPLENAILDILWRFREAGNSSKTAPPSRHTVNRRNSPAPWQIPGASTPLAPSPRSTGVSPVAPPGFGVAPPAFTRQKSSAASPFTSPRPSPRPVFATPHIPHSPSLNAYEFSDTTSTLDIYGDYGSDNVDWLVNDDTGSPASSYTGEGDFNNGGASEWVQPQTVEMGPYDILRSVMRDDKSDEEIEKALEANGYDLSATIMALMEAQGLGMLPTHGLDQEKTYLVGKSMAPSFRPATPAGQAKSSTVCKYWLSTGQCLRADCRFSHDLSNHVCKYWMMGNCLAGNTCIFSHDPSSLMSRLTLEDGSSYANSPLSQPNFQLQDYDSFPSLRPVSSNEWPPSFQPGNEFVYQPSSATFIPPPGLSPRPAFVRQTSHARPASRPTSRHHSRANTPSGLSVNDDEAFPTLGSAVVKPGKRHHGKRGGHGHHKDKDSAPNSLADVVRMSPAQSPSLSRRTLRAARSYTGSRENSAAAMAIPAPEHIPWLETGAGANQAYLRARQEAIKHGGLRNKFLQSAAQAWNRNDARAAKALSLRGQSENDLMRKAHREAARYLYEERNKTIGSSSNELYVDLHGLHPEEAVEYLERILLEQQNSPRPVYAITGTGHHSKNGKDKVGKAIRQFLNDWRYAYREFSVPGDRNNVGGILGVDARTFDRTAAGKPESGNVVNSASDQLAGKVKIVSEKDVLKEGSGDSNTS